MKVRRMDHVGIIVDDLAAAKAFFLELGLEVLGKMDLEGELVDKVTGLKGVRSSILMMGIPGGGTNLEFSKIHTHPDENGIQRLPRSRIITTFTSSATCAGRRTSSWSWRRKSVRPRARIAGF